ncbi:ABC transporter substrate-binding protein [Streptomyces sp. NPDC051183]|uniref:ABC transporter substrate-binding protein n=1 Tax=Streptomyces sp. NPDC051183 TaxID=3155165 RepID=UPI0034447454
MLRASAAAAAGAAVTAGWTSTASATARAGGYAAEEEALAELYAAAKAEGGNLVWYNGGDGKEQGSDTVERFQARFPGMRVTKLTDYSKYHETRLDLQFAARKVEADVTSLQNVHSFPRWKREGRLLQYKPLGWRSVPAHIKDPDGFFTATTVLSFSNVVNTNVIPAASAPRDPKDYLDPSLKGRLVFSYPTDDEAILLAWKYMIDQSGMGLGYMEALMRQDPLIVRGTGAMNNALMSGQRAASFSNIWSRTPLAGLVWQAPARSRFMTWGQPSAILKAATHPAAAKLFVSWSLSLAEQATAFQWPARRDVATSGPFADLSQLNTDQHDFIDWQSDRAEIEKFRLQLEYFVGTPQGPNPAMT